MAKNRVNATVEPEAIESVMQAIADIRGFLPFLIDLSLEERKTLARMGDKSRAFVDRAYDLAVQNPDFLPRSFSIDDMKMSVELFDAMHPLIMAIRQLLELMDDTYKAVGADAYSAALAVYNYAKASDSGLAIDEAVKELYRRFERKARVDSGEEEAAVEDLVLQPE